MKVAERPKEWFPQIAVAGRSNVGKSSLLNWLFRRTVARVAKAPGKIRFCIGPPIMPGGQKPKELNLIAQEWIEGKMNEISSLYKERTNAN